jgi:hypothetical protein
MLAQPLACRESKKPGSAGNPPKSPNLNQKPRTAKLPPTIDAAGDWRDLTEIEFDRLLKDLRNAFWKRPVQEFQPDGTWVAIKPR